MSYSAAKMNGFFYEMQTWPIAARVQMAMSLLHSCAIDQGSEIIDGANYDSVAQCPVYVVVGTGPSADALRGQVASLVGAMGRRGTLIKAGVEPTATLPAAAPREWRGPIAGEPGEG
jgi:hypothetical protein